MDKDERTQLIRTGNTYFNEGNIEEAKKCFIKAKYQDGLRRIGDYFYYDQKKPLIAINYYRAIGDTSKVNEIYERMGHALNQMLKSDKIVGENKDENDKNQTIE